MKAVYFDWKLAHIQYLKDTDSCFDIFSTFLSFLRFIISNLNLEGVDSFSETPNLNPFFKQIWVEKVEFSTLPENLYRECLENVIVRIDRKVWKKR